MSDELSLLYFEWGKAQATGCRESRDIESVCATPELAVGARSALTGGCVVRCVWNFR
jgi:hypothetical protein